ncbi:MAG: hypothetical protein ACI4DP_02480 [Candidatus Ornithomonoglobus sp.]
MSSVLRNRLTALMVALAMLFGFNNIVLAEGSEASASIVITAQPVDCIVGVGGTVYFNVEAEGEELTYKWCYTKNGTTWNQCNYGETCRKKEWSFPAVEYRFAYKYRCLIKDKYGNELITNEVRLVKPSITITKQPTDVYCAVGSTAKFDIEAEGSGVTYRWYYSKDGKTWNTCQYGTTYREKKWTFQTASYQYAYKFRCLVKDKNGNSMISTEVSLNQQPVIVNPDVDDVYCDIGDTAEFKVFASGTGLKYRWYYSKNGGASWATCQYGNTYRTDTLTAQVVDYMYGYMFRCNVTDSMGNVITTNSAVLRPKELKITGQPQSLTALTGSSAVLNIEAEGYKTAYMWFVSSDGGESWFKADMFDGCGSASLTVPAEKEYSGYRFYCRVSDKTGGSINSDAVTLTVEDAPKSKINILNDEEFDSVQNSGYNTIIDADYFAENVIKTETDEKYSINLPITADVADTDVLMLRFTAYAADKCGKLKVYVGGEEYTGNFVLQTEKTDYYLPVSGKAAVNGISMRLLTDFQEFSIGNLELVNCGAVDVTTLKTGMYNLSGTASETVINVDDKLGTQSSGSVTDGEYLYSVHAGTLKIYSLENKENPELVKSLSGLGNSRDIAFCRDGKALAVSARENGVYLVNIEDRTNPYIISNIDTLELATGICTEGDYLFSCSRNFGVEIFDISDLANPKYCSQVSDEEEYYDCCVDNGYLYVSSWAQRNIHIYDLSDVYNPVFVSEIALNGNGGGCEVRDGILYVATSYHSPDDRTNNKSSGYGMGSGLDIIDVSDAENPKWLSTAKNDGRYFYSGFDHWRVSVSGNYAYMTDTFCGAYIIDISNPENPKRVDKVTVNIPKTSSYYKKINQGTYIFPYDTVAKSQAVLAEAAVADGYVYFASYTSGIYVYPFENARYASKENKELSGSARQYTATDANIPGYSVSQYPIEGCAYAIASSDNYYFCASGSEGITVLDKSMNVVNTYKASDAVKDVKIYGDYLYTAECNSGMGVYEINGAELSRIGGCTYSSYNTAFSQLTIFPDGKHIGAQAGFTRFLLINTADTANPQIEKAVTTGSMYYRNLCTGLVSDKYVCQFDRSYLWYYKTDDSGNVSQMLKLTNSLNAETNGTAAYGDYAVAIYNNGYAYYKPAEISTAAELKANMYKVSGAKFLKGKLAMNGSLAVASYGYAKQLTLFDLSDMNKAVLLAQFYVEGNPDVACCMGDEILVPLRYGGILRIAKE